MMHWLRRIAVALLGRYGRRLRFPHLLLLSASILCVDLFVPDAIPFLDEIVLGMMTLLFASWRERRGEVELPARESGAIDHAESESGRIHGLAEEKAGKTS